MKERMKGVQAVWVCCLVVLLSPALPAHAKRVALVVGNAKYEHETTLNNPVNDAVLIEKTLRAPPLRFDKVTFVANANKIELLTALNGFKREAQGADVALVYYSGHGMSDGKRQNHVLPVDMPKISANAALDADTALEAYGVSEDKIIEAISEAKVQVAILDACRDNGFVASKSGTKGLGRRNDESRNRLIAYATEQGRTAEDGKGRNSTYAASLAQHLVRTDWPLLKVFDEVASDVERSTNHTQSPTRSGNLRTDVYLLASVKPEPNPAYRPPLAAPTQGGGLNLDDLKREEENRKVWAQWQARMKADYDKTAAFEGSADLQAKAWERFLAAWGQDNPLSGEDEGLRLQAQGRMQEQQQAAQRLAAATAAAEAAAAAAPTPQLATGNTLDGRYQILASGAEVKDLQTGLVWQRCSVGQQWNGRTCTGKVSEFTFDQARALSRRGWRVPSMDELVSLVDKQAGSPTIHAQAFPGTPANRFWTSTPRAGDSGDAWVVDFGVGVVYGGSRSGFVHVRLVR